jgi:hypothetical protein
MGVLKPETSAPSLVAMAVYWAISGACPWASSAQIRIADPEVAGFAIEAACTVNVNETNSVVAPMLIESSPSDAQACR